MSTMYYSYPQMEPIGQVHSLGKDKGIHFTWCMFPLAVVEISERDDSYPIRDEYGNSMSFEKFAAMVDFSSSQSFDERIAE